MNKVKRIAALTLLVGTMFGGVPLSKNIDGFVIPGGRYKSRIITPGENLWDIAKDVYGVGNVAYKLAFINKINNPELIMPGDEIVLPDSLYLAQYCIEHGYTDEIYMKDKSNTL